MKTERRHELQTNELADWLGTNAEAVKPHLKSIIGLAVLALVAVFAITLMRGQRQGQVEAAWTEYFAAAEMNDLDGLRDIAEHYNGTEPGAWAHQSAGDMALATGIRNLFVDKASGRENLLEAQTSYEGAIANSKEPMLLQRAHMGLAQVYESLGELDNAISEYDTVASNWPDSPLANEAADRKRFLESPSTQVFSDWFAKQEPPKKDAIDEVLNPSGGLQPPSTGAATPDAGAISLEEETGLNLEALGTEPPTTGITEPEMPAESADETAPNTPAEESAESGDSKE